VYPAHRKLSSKPKALVIRLASAGVVFKDIWIHFRDNLKMAATQKDNNIIASGRQMLGPEQSSVSPSC
jgi:hypothetical protein